MAYNLPTWNLPIILCIKQVLNMKLSNLSKEIEMNLSHYITLQKKRTKKIEVKGKCFRSLDSKEKSGEEVFLRMVWRRVKKESL